MRHLRIGLLAAIGSLGLAACSSPEPAPDDAATSETSATAVSGSSAPAGTATPVTEIPEIVRGEWGINPADCDVSSGAAKGNLQIGADTLKFYESVGKLERINALSKYGIGGEFAFTGEGQEWRKTMQLFVSTDGKTLTREEFGPDAIPEPLKYTRCPE